MGSGPNMWRAWKSRALSGKEGRRRCSSAKAISDSVDQPHRLYSMFSAPLAIKKHPRERRRKKKKKKDGKKPKSKPTCSGSGPFTLDHIATPRAWSV